MKVKVGDVTFSDAIVKRYIDLSEGFPALLIRIDYKNDKAEMKELSRTNSTDLIPFEFDQLKTMVSIQPTQFVDGDPERPYLILREFFAPCNYKSIQYESLSDCFLIPEDVKGFDTNIDEADKKDLLTPSYLSILPYWRLILREGIPEEYFTKEDKKTES